MTDRAAIEAMIAATAARVSMAGVPDFLNVWLTMTPERLADNEASRARLRQGPLFAPATDWKERPMKMGPKEEALRAAREGTWKSSHSTYPDEHHDRFGRKRPKLPAGAPAPTDQPATAEAAQHQETDMAIKATRKTATKGKGKRKGKTSARRQKGAAKPAARNTARAPAKGGVREGSKLATIVGLLQRASGCTTKDVLAATEWPSVSMPQQAKAAGITLATEKEGNVTRYWDAATKPKKD